MLHMVVADGFLGSRSSILVQWVVKGIFLSPSHFCLIFPLWEIVIESCLRLASLLVNIIVTFSRPLFLLVLYPGLCCVTASQNWLYIFSPFHKNVLMNTCYSQCFIFVCLFVFNFSLNYGKWDLHLLSGFLLHPYMPCLCFSSPQSCHSMAAESRLWPQPEPWLPASHSASVGLFSHSICN